MELKLIRSYSIDYTILKHEIVVILSLRERLSRIRDKGNIVTCHECVTETQTSERLCWPLLITPVTAVKAVVDVL